MQMKSAMQIKPTGIRGFTLLELLVALTVATILTTVSLNVYSTFHHGIVESSLRYEQFVSEKVNELRCRTRFVRGLPPCDFPLRESRASNGSIRLRFSK